MGPSDSIVDIYVGWAVEVGGIALYQEGIGVSSVIGHMDVFTAEWTGNHENNK